MNKLISIVVLLFAFAGVPAFAQLPPTNTYGLDFAANNQQTVAQANHLRLRYNSTTGQLEQSISGGPYFELLPTTSVISFGAKCDGITNDAVAFQNAINAVQATGGTLSIPHGTCIISAALTLGTTPIRIIGDGLRSTILKAGAVINAMFQFADLADNTFFQFFDFAIDGNVETNYGIISARANHTLMVRLRIQQTEVAAISLGDGWDNDFDSLEIANNGGDGIDLTNNDSANNVANIFQSNIFLNSGIGVYSFGGAGLNIEGCDFEDNRKAGIYLQLLTRAGRIVGNYFENDAATGIVFTSPSTETVNADIIVNGSATLNAMNNSYPSSGLEISGNYTNNSFTVSDFVFLLAVNGIQINNNVTNNPTNQSLIGLTAQGAGSSRITGLSVASNSIAGPLFDARDTTTQNVQFNTVDWTIDSSLKKNYFNSNPSSNVIVVNNSQPTTLTLSTKKYNGSFAMEFPAQAGGTDVMGQSFSTATNYPELAGALVYFAAYVSVDDPAESVALFATGPQYNTASNLGDTNWHLVQTMTIMPTSGTAVFGFRKFGANAKAYVSQPVVAMVGATYNAFYVNAGILAVTQLNTNAIESLSSTPLVIDSLGTITLGVSSATGITIGHTGITTALATLNVNIGDATNSQFVMARIQANTNTAGGNFVISGATGGTGSGANGAQGGSLKLAAGPGGSASGAFNPGNGNNLILLAGGGGAGGTGNASGGNTTIDGGPLSGTGTAGQVQIGASSFTSAVAIGTSTNKLGFYGSTAIVRPSSQGSTVTGSLGSITPVFTNTTFTGGLGTTAYTPGDIVLALKQLGLLTQ